MRDDADLTLVDGFAVRERPAEQQKLFAMDEVILPPSVLQIRKPVAMIHAIPQLGPGEEMTLNMRRLQNALITHAQHDLQQRQKAEPGLITRILSQSIQPLFEISIGALADLAQIEGTNYERIYDALYRLQDLPFLWNVLGEDASIEWQSRAHFLSNVSKGVGENRGRLRYRFDFDVLALVLEPRLWASFTLNPNTFGTPASLALYENCWRYVKTTSKRTAVMPVMMWIELLCGAGKYLVKDTRKGANGAMKPNYGEFKRSVLTDSIARVNGVSSLNHTLELIEHKQSNRVTHLQFQLVEKKNASKGLPLMWQGDLTDVLLSLGFTERQIEDMSEAHDQEAVREGLRRLQEAQTRLKTQGKPMHSKQAYLLGILGRMAADGKNAPLDLAALEKEVKTREAEQKAEERQRLNEEAFARHQSDVFNSSLKALDADRREALTEAYTKSAEGRRLLSTQPALDLSKRMHQHLVRAWLRDKRPLEYAELLPNPEDKTIEAWLAWRLEQAQAAPQVDN